MNNLEKSKKQFEYAKQLNDNFCKFNLLWISFNCFYNGKFRGSNKTDRDYIENCKNDSDINNSFLLMDKKIKDDFFTTIKTRRNGKGGVRNLLKNKLIEYLSIDDFSQYLEIIYTIRNNQFHGGKDPFDENDIKLLSNASLSFESFLNKLYN